MSTTPRVFIAATADAASERDAVLALVARWAKGAELLEWPGEPDVARPGEGDLFVGVARLRFDREGGTAEAGFTAALREWRGTTGQCFLVRSMRPPESLADLDSLAFHRLCQLFQRAEDAGFDVHLAATDDEISEALTPRLSALESQTDHAVDDEPAGEISAVLTPGEAYEVTFLSVVATNYSELSEMHRSEPAELRRLREAFRRLVVDTAVSYGGDLFEWEDDGGLIVFWRKRNHDHAIMTGLKVMHNLPVFNLDLEQNPLADALRVSCGAHDAVIVFRLPMRSIDSPDLQLVRRLGRSFSHAGEIAVSSRLLGRVDHRLRPRFAFKGRLEHEPIHVCRLPTPGAAPELDRLIELEEEVRGVIDTCSSLLAAYSSAPEATSIEAVGSAVEEAYAGLHRLTSRFSHVEVGWGIEVLEKLASTATGLGRREAQLWRDLRRRYAEAKASTGGAARLEPVVRSAARRRARSVVILEKMALKAQDLGGRAEEDTTVASEEALGPKINAFLNADALDRDTALTDLLMNHSDGLVRHLAESQPAPALLEAFWGAADVLLLDAVERRDRGETSVFAALASRVAVAPRFAAVEELLARLGTGAEAARPAVASAFESRGVEPTDEVLQVGFRCLVLGHGAPAVRDDAARELDLWAIWQTVAHPGIPIASLHAIGGRVIAQEAADAQKIFFDSIRGRVAGAIEAAQTRTDLQALSALFMLLMDLPFLVETGYFERFDDLLRAFLARTKEAGLNVDYFEELRKTLETASRSAGRSTPSKLPAGVKRLPLTLQRRLAGESRYLLWFVTHPDVRIAGETLRHIGLANVERVLRLKEINGAVFQALLKKPEFFTRLPTLLTALNHPKCEHAFAAKHVPSLVRTHQGRKALETLVRNSSASPAVRAMARRALGKRRA